MSNFNPQNFDQVQHSDIIDNDNFENDDLIAFQCESKTFNFFYSQLTKYSKHIREFYLFSDVNNRLPQEIQQFESKHQLLPESVDLFFQLLQQNYDINEDLILTYIQCVDLLKLSKFLEIRKLSSKINQYIKSHNIDVDFIIQMIQYDLKTKTQTYNRQIEISDEMEEILTSKINECLSNDKFKELPIEIIYRIIEKSSPEVINSNELFDIIIKSLNQFCVLFQFLELQKLSDDRLSKLCEMYSKSNENTRHYFNYLKCNLNLINEINKRKKNLEEMNEEQQNKMKEIETFLQKQINDSEKVNSKLQNQLDDSNNLINEQQNKIKDLEEKIISLQNQFNDSKNLNIEQQNQMKEKDSLFQKHFNEQQNKIKEIETLLQKQFNESEKVNDHLKKQFNNSEKMNNQLQNQLNDSKNLNIKQQNKINDLENQISQLKNKLTSSEKEITDMNKQLKKIFIIKGQIVANVEKGFFINAEINLKEKGSTLDTSKSKAIISTSDAKNLGSEAYEKGEPITSLHMTTRFACKIGRYYVRCIVFNSEGESNEIVSNPVTTNASSLTFDYEGKAAKISLPQGQYKLEVWGAKGGDSTGNGHSSHPRSQQSSVPGGLGGYSRGILSLNKEETVYVFVGEEGRPSNSTDGSSTKGGFPDGGGTKTGHYSNYTSVPGTGGGSTSIRIGSDTNYSRVIVAGGGGGASGDCYRVSPGGFGGGQNGGNCYYCGSLKDQGGGTQTGSTRGLGEGDDRHGDPGAFGSGATGKYCNGNDSGGGGGGGWYGGGSGGYGAGQYCSGGGGGSGWTFTETSLQRFKSGDSSNASKFELKSTHYLTDEKSFGGNEEFPRPDGNGNERGHSGHGYAKITPL